MTKTIMEELRVRRDRISIAKVLHDFVGDEVLPGTGLQEGDFWSALDAILHDLTPQNRALLARREDYQRRIDAWHREHRAFDPAEYKAFLGEIGYLQAEGADFSIKTEGLDPEISTIAGPQLVVPVTNARFALNALNARWGSLYDALYGTDAIPGTIPQGGYDAERGKKVIAFARAFLDEAVPLQHGSHHDVLAYSIVDGRLVAVLTDGGRTGLRTPGKFAGFRGEAVAPSAILLVNHGLHIELHIDRSHPIGRSDAAGISDIVLEAAVTTIMDFEDSIAAVDAADKTAAYRNWLGLVRGTLTAAFKKDGRVIVRRANPDRSYTAPDGSSFSLPGRSLMLVRNAGHLMSVSANWRNPPTD